MKSQLKEAIALEYGRRKTPVISAKGQDDLAQKIIEEALKHGVYVAQDPQLLALLGRVDLDAEIPPEMYTAVAVILSWVYWLKGMRPGDEKTKD
ncbi:MAG: EscU/YscU/HrcU family type III secretion system export apparatus switch protein [Limnohabitans sp.]|jgi:flagellar biosynthesis protein|uniref:EscU/YscU/HrcU family type III secretion system export apparatus switch protein n=1 Tax=Limnohabitans sp. TaxID=1907725 RepID=UPI0025EE1BED|nr:EscU/YscU/HrcU family type III secretion system export apparatus switch protein [Limnohabitans sp.]MCO4088191.1 EscU/YscU/HrcU family type III secretion system export apparatus switch protein [Limnohabitans sp.]